MDQARKDQIAEAAKSRTMAQKRRDERTAEIAGQQARLKHEAEQRREQNSKPR